MNVFILSYYSWCFFRLEFRPAGKERKSSWLRCPRISLVVSNNIEPLSYGNALTGFETRLQGHPMDPFLKIPVLKAIFAGWEIWKKYYVLGRKVKVLLGNRQFRVSRDLLSRIAGMCYLSETSPHWKGEFRPMTHFFAQCHYFGHGITKLSCETATKKIWRRRRPRITLNLTL